MNKQKYVIASVALLLFGTIFVSSYFGSLGSERDIRNNPASILSSVADFFGFGACTPETIPEGSIVYIDDRNNTIDVTVPYGNYSSMCFAPEIQTLYSKAVVTPASGEAVDFTNPVTYTVDQGGFVKSYVVTIKANPLVTTINTCEDLQNMKYSLSEQYNLGSDIDCSGLSFTPIGSSSAPFNGSLEGNGYTISGLSIDRPAGENAGLFGYTNGANISNLKLTDVYIIGGANSGSLVGSGSGNINYVSVTGSISATSSNSYMGGIAGNFSGSVGNTSFEGDINFNGDKICSYGGASYPCSENSYVGGLVGNSEATIESSYFSGNVKSDALYTGGLVGVSLGNINNSYAKGVVKGGAYFGADVPYRGTGYTGGLIGSWWGGLVSNSYFAGDVSFKSLPTSYYYTYCGGGLAGDGYGATFNNSFAVTNFNCVGNRCDGYNTEAGALGGCGRYINMKDSAVYYTGSYIKPFAYGSYHQVINTSVAPNKEYFFGDPVNLPMNTWDANIWSFVAGEYPKLKTGPVPTVSLNVSSTTAIQGDTATLTWTPTNSTSCIASGNDPYWNGSSMDYTNGSHTWTTAPLTVGTYNYDISCTGDNGTATSTAVVVVEPVACSSFTYSDWSTCSGGTQTRTATNPLPAGCVGGEPVLSQSCVIPCESFTYSPWSTCSGATQVRTVTNSLPAGCGGGSPVLSQSCITPLEWSANFESKTWTDADAFCRNPVNDYKRLPTIEELKTVLTNQFINKINNPGGFVVSKEYWSNSSSGVTTIAFPSWWNHYYFAYWSNSIQVGQIGSNYQKSFRCVREPKAAVNLSASSATVVEGNTATLTWTSANAFSCVAGGNEPYWTGSPLDVTSGPHTWTTAPLTVGTHTYDISCTGGNGTATSKAVVTVTPVDEGGGGGTTVPGFSFAGGTGTVADPYQIANWTHLNSVRNNLSSNYILTADLASTSAGYANLGDNWTPIGNSTNVFNGSFNGNSKKISDLKIKSSGTSYVGLFGYSTGNISYLGLTNISITNKNDYVGSIAGQMGGGTITESYSTGNILGLTYVGGLVGKQAGGIISNSYSWVNITDFNTFAGGFVGQQSGGSISDSYSTGKLTNSSYGPWAFGGFIGEQYPPITNKNSYWDKQTSGQDAGGGALGKTTTEMKTPATFSLWDRNIWNITSGKYPTLVPYSDQMRVSFTTNSNKVPNGGKVTLSWVVANVKTCTASGGDSLWSVKTLTANDDSYTSGNLSSGTYTYSISCSGGRGTVNDSTIVTVNPGPDLSPADLNCNYLSMTSPVTSSNQVNINNNTVWKAVSSSTCSTCTVNWSVTDTNNPNPPMVSGTNPWNKIFTTVGLKTVTAQFVSPSGASGKTCATTTTVVQTGGGTEI